MRVIPVCLLAVLPFEAQTISAGLKVGVPLTALVTASSPGYQASTRRYTLGPAIELKLVHRLALEAGALYKRLEFGYSGAGSSAGRWEFPFLVKYRFRGWLWRPFVGAGASLNWVNGSGGRFAELRHGSAVGIVAGTGIETRLGRLRLAPEVRFTRWADRNLGVRDASLRSSLTQAEILAGLTF